MIEEHSEQSYTEVGHVESAYLDHRTGDFTETYREDLPLPETDDDGKELQRLTSRETKRVQFWRVVLVISLLVIGALVVTGAYLLLSQSEVNTYLDGVSKAH